MSIEMVSLLGGLGLLLVLAALAIVNQVTDNETSVFTISVGIVLFVAILALFQKAGA
jgi:hypothetical protein